ncbi:MAG: 5-dehydro-4-deoxy-D-glucuronate isomerase [Gemmatimonadaceae bacterium]
MHQLPDPERTKRLTTDELRAGFLVQGLFTHGEVVFRHADLDRVLLAGAVPLSGPLRLDAPGSVAAAHLADRREIGVLNVGARGAVTVDGTRYVMDHADILYIGRGGSAITLESDSAAHPAHFFCVSYPAHTSHPTTRIGRDDAQASELGAADGANRRRLAKYIHPGGAASAQLVMGVTELEAGSVWNTMPPHRHERRTEVYLYFDLADDAVVVHLMGEPGETRHLIVRDGEAVLSPPWSIHAGCGTGRYAFCWAMGGENQDFADMQAVDMRELK